MIRCRCVCREWCFLISNPNFISKHLSKASSSSTCTLVRQYSKTHSKQFYSVFQNENFTGECTRINPPSAGGKSSFYSRVVGNCNGVLCLSDDLFGYNETIILWNPSTRRAINVPSPRITFNLYGVYMFSLGFRFDSKNSDYKVVRVAYLWDDGYKIPPKVEVFSVNSGKWRFVKSNITFCITEFFWSQAVRNGVVHWVGFKPSGMVKGRNLIVSFDLSNEMFGDLTLPESLENVPVYNMIVAILGGSISLIRYASRTTNCDSCAIWVMKEYGDVKSWVNQYNVSLEGGLGMVLDMRGNGEIILSSSNGELVLYNCENGKAKRTGIHGTRLSFFVNKYVESLALLGKGREVRGRDSEPDYEDEDELIEWEENENLKITMTTIIGNIINTRMN